MIKLSALVLASSLVLFSACKKKDDAAKADEPAPAAKMADQAPAAAAPTPAAPAAAAPAPAAAVAAAAPAGGAAAPAASGKTFASFDEYDAANLASGVDAGKIFDADGTDCTKLAADITKYAGDHKDDIAATRAFEAAHPEADKQTQDKHPTEMKAMMDKVVPGATACKDNKDFIAAMNLVK